MARVQVNPSGGTRAGMPAHLRSRIAATAAALAALAGPAAETAAQAIVYGRLVGGIEHATHVVRSDGSVGSRTSAASSQWGSSMLGVRGEEALGGGWTALYKMEGAIDITTGHPSGALWNRFSYVGLASPSAGTLRLGNFLSVSNDVWYLDPTGQQWLGSAVLVKGRNWNGAANAIQYDTPAIGGFAASIQHSFGDGGGAGDRSAKTAVSLVHRGSRHQVRFIADTARDAGGRRANLFEHSHELTLGATWDAGDVTWFAAAQRLHAPDATAGPDRAIHWWAGLHWQATPALTWIGAFYRVGLNRGGGSARLAVTGVQYRLSGRTLLYATLGSLHNGATTDFSERYWEPQRPGLGRMVGYYGIAHSF